MPIHIHRLGVMMSLALAHSVAQPSPLAAQSCQKARLVISPKTPVAGTLFRIAVPRSSFGAASRSVEFSGTLAGEPLRFRASGDSLVAIAAAPIDSSSGLTLRWQCRKSGDSDVPAADSLRINISTGNYRLEQLKVAPRFTAAPDSALTARMASESARAAAVSRGAHDTPRQYSAPFRAPRTSRITSGFGSGRTFNDSVTSRHMGTDYAGAIGAPVLAANRGIVRLVDRFYLGGNVVYLDHGDGLVTAYLHLSKTRVAVGDTVARGQRIGDVGATGRVTGPHLHFIARYGQITVNPLSLVGRAP